MFFLVRHGERGDKTTPEEKAKINLPWDVHLTEFGHEQGYKTGEMIS